MKKTIFTVLTVSFFISTTFGQTFIKQIGSTSKNEGGNCIASLNNKELVIGGFENDSSILVSFSTTGVMNWGKKMKFTSFQEAIVSLLPTSDNKIVAAGIAKTGTSHDQSIGYYFKFDPQTQSIIWSHQFQSPSIINNITESPNGNYWLQSIVFSGAAQDIQLTEVSSTTGQITSLNKRLTMSNSESAPASLFYNNKYYLSGRVTSGGGTFNYMRSFISEFSIGMSENWTTLYPSMPGQNQRTYGESLLLDNNDFVVGGFGDLNGASSIWSPFMFKTSMSGTLIWAKYYSFPNYYTGQIFETVLTPNGYLNWGIFNQGTNQSQLFQLMVDVNGNLLWTKSYGGPGIEDNLLFLGNPNMVVLDGFAYSVASSTSFGGGDKDLIFLKTDLNGNISTGCFENEFGISNNVQMPIGANATFSTQIPVISGNASANFTPIDLPVKPLCLGTSVNDIVTNSWVDFTSYLTPFGAIEIMIENASENQLEGIVQIFDVLGKEYFQSSVLIPNGKSILRTNRQGYSSGIYLAVITVGGQKVSKKIFIP